MPRRRYPLTPKVQEAICAFLRSGAFPHIAAEAAGIPRDVFAGWIRKASQPRARKVYRDFQLEVIQAMAQARITAEMKAFKDAPLAWLTRGPGRETEEGKGWTVSVKPSPKAAKDDVDVLGLMARLLQLLAPFPDARKAVAGMLQGNMPAVEHQPPAQQGSP